ncbi:substrate-binding domain-containing protein [Dactylosporangium sp. NPDC000244]|uniref:substrate-binding domain-containing protein n=1 Tax=Dactylosporangium sp. NPDC000244 TaxID=3154365 RepID=UPI00332EBCD3
MGHSRRLISELAVSLASGAILAIAAKISGVTTKARWLMLPTPFWSLVLASATAVTLALFLVRSRVVRQKRVLVMIPAFAQKHWLAAFVQHAVQTLETQGFEATLKLPLHDFSGQGQMLQLAEATRRPRDYSGAFLIVAEPEAMTADLRRFCSSVEFPVVFVDVMPFAQPDDLPARSCYVGSSQADIGVEAARWVADRMIKAHKNSPHILVIAGTGQAGRQKAFVETLADKLPGASVEVNPHGAFVRGKAEEIVSRHLRRSRRHGRPVDVIFCTSDEMALGAVDAIEEEKALGHSNSELLVIGVDGTDEAMSVIRAGGTNFQGTVVQDSRRMAEAATSVLIRAVEGNKPRAMTVLPVNVYPHESP